jgi:type I restriction enzyme M protein
MPASAGKEVGRLRTCFVVWRGDKGAGKYEDIPGFCRSVTTEEIGKHGFVLTPGRYVGVEEVKEEEGVFEEKMVELTATLGRQFAERDKLEKLVRKNLEGLGYAIK